MTSSLNDRIAISSCAFTGIPFAEVEAIALKNDFLVEFSSGFRYEPGLPEQFKDAKCRRWIHNYFPPPIKPFVLNLASTNLQIWQQSIDHARAAIRLAATSNIPFYSIHSGFGIDPKVSELGVPIQISSTIERKVYVDRFIEALRILLADAETYRVDLYIENNVVIEPNRKLPLLCAEADETAHILKTLNHKRLGLLLDTAHLKVSANTLGFSADAFIQKLRPFIRAVHHSDNDGLRDSNQPLSEAYWFLPYMPTFSEAFHVIEVNAQQVKSIQHQIQLLATAGKTTSSC